MNLDLRTPSQAAYRALVKLKEELDPKYHKKASGLVQGLTAYISTWGLHRLSGDTLKYSSSKSPDTRYKGTAYEKYLVELKAFSGSNFTVKEPPSLINMPLREYTALNRLAIELAREWSFWATPVLGEAEEL